MKKEHPHAQVLRWIADGEDVQARRSDGSETWWSFPGKYSHAPERKVLLGEPSGLEFRIKPKTIRIGDREIEAPVMSGEGYYITQDGHAYRWFEDSALNPLIDLQKRGLVYASEEAARAAQEAITALLTREPS